MIVEDDERDFETFLHGRHQFGRVHEESPVTDDDKDLTLGVCQTHAEAGGELIAHARVAVLDVAV